MGRSLRRPRSLARRAPFVDESRAPAAAAAAAAAAGACLCWVRGGRAGPGLEAPWLSRAGTAFAWEQGASCRVHTPERKLRMKLLWQAKMVTRTLCLLPRLLWWGIFSRFLWAGFGLTRSERSNPIPDLRAKAFSLGFLRLPLCVSSPFKPYFLSSCLWCVWADVCQHRKTFKAKGLSLGEPRSASVSQRLFKQRKLQV